MPEILSQHQALIENNTIDDPKNGTAENKTVNKTYKYDSTKDEEEDRNEKEHFGYGHVDNSVKKFPPRFKHPAKMYAIDMKPAGNSIRLRCAFEGNLQ
jgi:hypothetical protein